MTALPLSPALRLCALACAASAAVAADSSATSWILRPEEAWSFTWEERRLANADGVSMPGFGRSVLPVRPGVWGEVGAGMDGSSQGRADRVPGTAPLPKGASGLAWAELWMAGGPVFLHLRPEVVVGGGDIANPVAREAWSGSGDGTSLALDAAEVAPRATLGISGFGHLLALSNEPFRWGEGIFGGVMLGQAWRGFPHVVLTTRGPQSPAPQGSWLEPLTIGYEAVLGQLSDSKPAAGDGVRFAGARMALRWEAVTVSWSKALLFGGSAQPDLGWGEVARAVASPRTGNDGAAGPGEPDPNRWAALGLRLDWPPRVAWSVEYGIDDQNPLVEGQRFNTTITQEARWTSATWTATADLLDLTGDGDWRLAAEWFRSESYVYDHSLYAWDDGGFPLAHADGGNAQSLRLLCQHVDGDEGRWTLVAGWRRQGWRNAEAGNPNTARKDTGVPGSSSFAERAWDRWSLDGRYEVPIGERWRWWSEAGAAWDTNRDFVASDDGLGGWVGLGAARSW